MPHSFITGSVYQVLFRAMAAEQDNLDKCRFLFLRSIALVAIYATPFYISLLWLAEPLIRGIYGEKWIEAAGPLMILALAWPFWLLETLSGAVLAARNWLNRELVTQISAIILTALAVLIGLAYGIRGVAWAIFSVSIYSAFYMLWLALSCLKAHWIDILRALAPAAILNLLLAGSLYLTDAIIPEQIQANVYFYLVTLSVVGVLVYASSFLYLPFTSLATEQQRWKIQLRLSHVQHPKS